jgi:hypothetical protein
MLGLKTYTAAEESNIRSVFCVFFVKISINVEKTFSSAKKPVKASFPLFQQFFFRTKNAQKSVSVAHRTFG